MLGHAKFGMSDLYALRDPANLGIALAATEGIIADIEHRVPGAFSASHTGAVPGLRVIKVGRGR